MKKITRTIEKSIVEWHFVRYVDDELVVEVMQNVSFDCKISQKEAETYISRRNPDLHVIIRHIQYEENRHQMTLSDFIKYSEVV